MMRILLLGASGQLGTEVRRVKTDGWIWLTPRRDQIDLADLASLEAKLAVAAPDAIVNAAAYTAVDKAEDEVERATILNTEAPALLARIAAARRIPLVHISTDYVFDGSKPSSYVEDDPVAPLGVYGKSKAQGERAVLATGANAAVLRTSWVFSAHGANFVKTMLRLGGERDVVRVVRDQYGRPTPARDLAHASVQMLQRLLKGDEAARGVFHFSGHGRTTWAEFAHTIFEEAAKRGRAAVRVEPITTDEYPTRARRPANSVLDTSKIEALGITPRPWIDGLRDCLDELLGAPA